MKTITIINAYGRKNIGDDAILASALNLIDKSAKEKTRVFVQSEDPASIIDRKYKYLQVLPVFNPYGYAIRGNKYFRFLICFLKYFESFVSKSFVKNIDWIRSLCQSDVVISMGGGYLISTDPIKDYFGLLLTLLPIYLSRSLNKRILFMPMSFGPFASNLHENLCRRSILGGTVLLRENISAELYRSHSQQFPDLAFMLPWKKLLKKDKYIAISARKWLPKEKQNNFEKTLAQFVDWLWTNHHIKSVFVPMAQNIIEDNDILVGNRIYQYLNNKRAFDILKPTSFEEAKIVFGKSIFGVHTRMHAGILSALTFTPFVLIGYGHKGKGIMDNFELEKYFIEMDHVNSNSLINLVRPLLKKSNHKEFIAKLVKFKKLNAVFTLKIIDILKSHLNNA